MTEQPPTEGVPARLVPYESRALTYRSDARKLFGAILAATLVCGVLAAVALLVGERRIVAWAAATRGDDQAARDITTFLLRAPRFLLYAVFALFFIIGLDRKQRMWVYVALIVLALELVFAGGLVRLLKIVVGRARPHHEAGGFRPFMLTTDAFHSFPSGEAADVAASVSFFVYFARRRGVRLIGLGLLAMVMYERVMNRFHNPTDVLAGAYILLVLSFVVWHWFVVGFPLKKLRTWFGQDAPPTAPDAGEIVEETP